MRAGQITQNDLITWEVQFRREGTLPIEVQVALLEYARSHFFPRRSSRILTERSSRP